MQYLLPMSRLGHLLIPYLMVIHVAKGMHKTHMQKASETMSHLLEGQIDTLSLEQLQTILWSNSTARGGIFSTNTKRKAHRNGLLHFSALTPLSPNDIVDVRQPHFRLLRERMDSKSTWLP